MTANPLIGKTVRAVYLADDDGAMRFDLDSGEHLVVHADGDCCSHTWIEHVEGPERMIGSPIISVEDIDMPDQPYDEKEHECIQFYGCKITTLNGSAVIDYRNESNGYYGGSLEWDAARFYGGVEGQNVSTEKWKPLAAAVQP